MAQVYLLDAFGYHAAMSGRARLTARLLGAAETMRADAAVNVMPFFAPLLTEARQSAIAAQIAVWMAAERPE